MNAIFSSIATRNGCTSCIHICYVPSMKFSSRRTSTKSYLAKLKTLDGFRAINVPANEGKIAMALKSQSRIPRIFIFPGSTNKTVKEGEIERQSLGLREAEEKKKIRIYWLKLMWFIGQPCPCDKIDMSLLRIRVQIRHSTLIAWKYVVYVWCWTMLRLRSNLMNSTAPLIPLWFFCLRHICFSDQGICNPFATHE